MQLQDYPNIDHQDVQATLLALTAETLADAIHGLHQSVAEMFVCGGGAFNHTLMAELEKLLPDMTVSTTAKLGIDPCWVEACAFAWLAKQRVEHKASNLMSVTGASREAVLGAVYLP
jgi:anhydro-N-acetylmuramic acid kinase